MKTIFVCTDFSSTGNNAVKFAVQYASFIKGNLVVFHVLRNAKLSPTITEAEHAELERKEARIQTKRLESLVDQIYRNVGLTKNPRKLRVAVKHGIFITETLVAAAKDYKADLIIIGTHGATGLKLFGSTSSEVIFKAQSPVMAIPPRYRYEKQKTIVYASDLNNLLSELRCIVPFAKPAKAVIEILNLNSGLSNAQSVIDEQELMKKLKYKHLKAIAQKKAQGITMTTQLQHYLKSHKPEVLVMFPEERSFLDKILVLSKTEELVYKTTIPLLTFQKSLIK